MSRHNEILRYVIAASLLTALFPFATATGGSGLPCVGKGRAIASGVCACAYCVSVVAIGFARGVALELFFLVDLGRHVESEKRKRCLDEESPTGLDVTQSLDACLVVDKATKAVVRIRSYTGSRTTKRRVIGRDAEP